MEGTCISFILFYLFRYYKRIDIVTMRSEALNDLRKINLVIDLMIKNRDSDIPLEIVRCLVRRTNSLGSEIKLKLPVRYLDYYDRDVILTMKKLTRELINCVKSPFYKRLTNEIFYRFAALQNLSCVLVDNSSGDSSISPKFHLTKKDAFENTSVYLRAMRKKKSGRYLY